nr:MAG TPA: hypothetical protein [Caudoviricetes sp.]
MRSLRLSALSGLLVVLKLANSQRRLSTRSSEASDDLIFREGNSPPVFFLHSFVFPFILNIN